MEASREPRRSAQRAAVPIAILLSILFISFAAVAQTDSSGPTGRWYFNANHHALTVRISSPSPGVYRGTLISDTGGAESVDKISWDRAVRTLKFRRVGKNFWEWYSGKVVEGIFVRRFDHAFESPEPPAGPSDYGWHATGWNSGYLDTRNVPRVWEILINQTERARLRIDKGSGGLLGRLKVYSSVHGRAQGEQLEYDLDAVTWDGTSLSFRQHLDGNAARTYRATVSGREIRGTYSPGEGHFTGTRAEVLSYGIAPKSAAARAQRAERTSRQLYHLMMAGNPAPLSRNVTVLGSNLPPTPSVTPLPDRDDNPAAWPANYTKTELRFDYTLPNPHGGAPLKRSSHAYLAVPNAPPAAGGKYPALLAVNGHSGSAWKMMNPDDQYFWYGDAFARRGFVVLAVDISHRPTDDRDGLYEGYDPGDDTAHGNGSHPSIKAEGFDSDWEEDGERSWDAMRALDYLTSLPNVNDGRILISGISLGGEVAAITGGLDPRLAMSIPVGYSPDEGVMRYHDNHECWEWLHADIRDYVDISDYFALTAPRPLLIETGKADPSFSSRQPPYSADKQVARRVIAAYGAEASRFGLYLHYDRHHYHVGDVNPASATERGVRVPELLTPALPWTLDWQVDGSTRTIQPTLFDWIKLYMP